MVVPIVSGVLGAAGLVLGVRRLLIWAARKGWIYYGDEGPPKGAAGMALMEWASNFKPEVEYVIEEQRSGELRLVHAETGEGMDGPSGDRSMQETSRTPDDPGRAQSPPSRSESSRADLIP